MAKKKQLNNNFVTISIVALLVIGGATLGGLYWNNRNNHNMNGMSMDSGQMSYAVNLMSGKSYKSGQPTALHFEVKQDGKTFKDFAIDSTKLMHLIVVRNDRSNFQHVHPTYDDKTGIFIMDSFQFPTDGQYRVFANFATTDAKKDMMGMIETEAPYVDVNVGDKTKVVALPLGADSLASTANGFTAMITTAPGGNSPSTTTAPIFYAGLDGTVEVAISKNGTAFKNLQKYLGNLGHMVILGPNLEFIHAHPILGDVNNQTGYIPFMVTFPTTGQYKLYLQTQVNDMVSTFNFNLTVQEMPKSTRDDNSMQGTNHMSH